MANEWFGEKVCALCQLEYGSSKEIQTVLYDTPVSAFGGSWAVLCHPHFQCYGNKKIAKKYKKDKETGKFLKVEPKKSKKQSDIAALEAFIESQF